MGEGFIVRRGGGGQQTVKPIFNSLTSVDFTSLTLNVTNDDNSIAALYYSVVEPEPGPTTSDTFDTEFAGKETKDITITGLTSGTTYTVYIKAYAIGAFPSETIIVTELTTGVAMTATGGIITEYNVTNSPTTRYRSHTFTGNGTFQVTQLSNMGSTFNQIDLLMVAGGGGGGRTDGGWGAGGGGAGGLIERTGTNVAIQNYSINIGSGGAGSTTNNVGGANGVNTTAFSLTAIGGGGGTRNTHPSGGTTNGGSGGGYFNGDFSVGSGLGLQPGSASGGFGNNAASSPVRTGGGGGGGAGGVGSVPTGPTSASSVGGAGGSGRNNNFRTGSNIGYGGGGGASSGTTGAATPAAAFGGGGRGGWPGNNPTSGGVNTGGGGGGSVETRNGGSGGSGIVVIRYEIAPV